MKLPPAWTRSCLSLGLSVLLLAQGIRAQVGTAGIEGRVANAATGNYLNNARVVIEGTTVEVFTNENGEFRLGGVTPGEVRLRVTYSGLEPQSATVRVSGGTPVRRDFELALPRSQTTASDASV